MLKIDIEQFFTYNRDNNIITNTAANRRITHVDNDNMTFFVESRQLSNIPRYRIRMSVAF